MEKLEVHIDGVTYRLPRRRSKKSGQWGFLLSAGAIVHGRPSWVQVLVIDRVELEAEARIKKSAMNRARRKASSAVRRAA
jgi:hypothetical protein